MVAQILLYARAQWSEMLKTFRHIKGSVKFEIICQKKGLSSFTCVQRVLGYHMI